MSEFVEFTNEYGQRIEMPRGDYQTKIIPHNFELYWDNREMLRQFAMELVRDQFYEEAGKAADRLLELYGPIEAALIFRAVVHMHAGEIEEAKQLLVYIIEQFPNSGTAFTNLAKIFVYEDNHQKAFEALEVGLDLDPNQENGLDWYVSVFMDHGEKESLLERLKRLAEKEEAWRPQFIMGRLALNDGNLLQAMKYYQESLQRSAGNEELLMNITGELGQAGYVYQLIQICEQYWSPTLEYPYVGFNYANALLATDEKAKAIQVLQQMREHISDAYKPAVENFLAQVPQGDPKQEEEAKQPEESEKKPGWKFWQ